MSNFATNDVKVFPSTYRKEIPQGKFTSENNFVNILNSLTDIDSYVLNDNDNILKVVIHGYYFEVSEFIKTSYDNLWLGIKVETGNNALVHYEKSSIDNLDENSQFQGLMYATSQPSDKTTDNYKCYYLKVVENKALINKVRLTTDSIKYNKTNKDLTNELESKQYILKTDETNFEKLDNEDVNKRVIQLTQTEKNKLSNILSKGGDGSKLFYFDNEGIAHNNDTIDIGSNVPNSSSVIESQSVYVLDGVITAGQTFYASVDNPSGGKKGDIWFKYSDK